MNLFEKIFNQVLAENNVSGGADSAFGNNNGQDIGSFGNQFPSQNSKAYNDGDARKLSPYGPAGAVLGAKVSKNKKRRKGSNVTVKFPIQRRTFPGQ